jgi:hypothetical protein
MKGPDGEGRGRGEKRVWFDGQGGGWSMSGGRWTWWVVRAAESGQGLSFPVCC